MVKKITKYLKFVVCCALILSLIAPSYAALSASDGSAFVTKAEFDAALADFNARLTTFEAGINSKIDSQVSSYLDRNGIWNGKSQTVIPGLNTWFAPSWFIPPTDWKLGQATGDKRDQMFYGWIGEDLLVHCFSPAAINCTKILKADKSGLLNLNLVFTAFGMWAPTNTFLNGRYIMASPPGETDAAVAWYSYFFNSTGWQPSPFSSSASAGPFNNYKGANFLTPTLFPGTLGVVGEYMKVGNPDETMYPELKYTIFGWQNPAVASSATMASNRVVGYEIFTGNPSSGTVLLADAIAINEVMINGGEYTNGSVFAHRQGSVTTWAMPTKNYSSYTFVSKGDILYVRNTWLNTRSYAFVVGAQVSTTGISAWCPWGCKITNAQIY